MPIVSDALPDALADALGGVVADLHREWQKDVARLDAEKRAFIAEQRLEFDALQAELRAKVEAHVPRDGKDGRDADTESIEQFIVDTVRSVVAEIEIPEGKEGPKGPPGEQGKEGPKGADGVGVAGAIITRDNELVLTLTDGRTQNLGLVVGKDGAPGVNGKDGAPGNDGINGLGFDDMDFAINERGAFLTFKRGDVEKEFRLPVPMDRGVYREGETYQPGDGVTWAGSFWIAQGETAEKPDNGKGWRLAVKKGRDGKDLSK